MYQPKCAACHKTARDCECLSGFEVSASSSLPVERDLAYCACGRGVPSGYIGVCRSCYQAAVDICKPQELTIWPWHWLGTVSQQAAWHVVRSLDCYWSKFLGAPKPHRAIADQLPIVYRASM